MDPLPVSSTSGSRARRLPGRAHRHVLAALISSLWLAAPALGAPRPIAPITASRVSRDPTVRWTGGAARVEVCRDRACTRVVIASDVDGERFTAKLPPGTWFWRVDRSPPWELVVAPLSCWVATAEAGRLTLYRARRTLERLGGAPIPAGRLGETLAFAGDLDGEGSPELAVGSPAMPGMVQLFRAGSLRPWRTLRSDVRGFGQSLAGVGDVDGDGLADLLVGGDGRAELFRGGPPSPPQRLEGMAAVVGAAGDVDGDGFSDLIVGAPHDDSAQLFLGSAGGARPSIALHGPPGSHFGCAAAAADLDGDGYSDVAIGACGGDQVFIYRGGPGGLSATPSFILHEPFGSPPQSLIAAGDLDGDGLPDLAVGGPQSVHGGKVSVIFGAARDAPALVALDAPGEVDFGPPIAVLDGDGSDALLASGGRDRMWRFRGGARVGSWEPVDVHGSIGVLAATCR